MVLDIPSSRLELSSSFIILQEQPCIDQHSTLSLFAAQYRMYFVPSRPRIFLILSINVFRHKSNETDSLVRELTLVVLILDRVIVRGIRSDVHIDEEVRYLVNVLG